MAALMEVRIPDMGDFADVPVIEILVAPGDTVAAEDPLVVIESDKAATEVPAPFAGVVAEIAVSVGDEVSEGDLVLTLTPVPGAEPDTPEPDGAVGGASAPGAAAAQEPAAAPEPPSENGAGAPEATPAAVPAPSVTAGEAGDVYAGPGARHAARALGIDLAAVRGTGPRGRVTREDVAAHAEAHAMPDAPPAAAAAAVVAGPALPPWPRVDHAAFGPIETVPLARLTRIAGPNLARNWAAIPHVTQHDEADVTELEAFRIATNAAQEAEGTRVTMVALVLKACAAALQAHPNINASLEGESLVRKRYYHLGFAADTPNGLVVPVIRDVDRKGVLQIARELADLSRDARDGRVGMADMQGGTFTVSSLGGIGGTGFTPIINAPEVAILGVSRATTRPVWIDGEFRPRLMLPLSLSYDHRAVDGAAAARFTTHLAALLADLRRLLL